MGLDMYLYKKTYIGAHFKHLNVKGIIQLTEGEENKPIPIQLNRVSEITEMVGYWRKANHIHKWFVDNVQNGVDECEESYVSEENLKKLLEKVNNVINQPALAGNILPTQNGFFFGGTDYDIHYLNDLQDTKKIIEDCLKEDGEYYYKSSW